MDFDGIELRELERITEPDIPAAIKTLYIDTGSGAKISAETTDYNIKGLRLLFSSDLARFDRGEGIIIAPADNSYRLMGEIRHIVNIHNNTTYLGVKFYPTKSLTEYEKIIDVGMIETEV